MPKRQRSLKRFEGFGDIRYLTCSCYHRLALFNNDKIKDAFVEYLIQAKHRLGFRLYAWVLMPEHLHLLMRPVSSDQSAGQVLRGIKAGFAKTTLQRWQELEAPILDRITNAAGRQRFWQTGGGYDRNLYSEQQVHKKIAYIHQNPTRRGLVASVCDWPWSSALWYERREAYSGPELDRLM